MNAPSAGAHAGTPGRHWLERGIAWSGAALFVGALGFFAYAYLVTFGDSAAARSPAAALAVNVGLFTVFALHHSLFARERVRGWVARLVSPALERSAYVWIASLMLIAVCALWQPLPGAAWQVGAPWMWLLHGGQAAGVWLTLRSAQMIDIWELAGIRQAGAGPARRPVGGGFRTDGPYGWVRHPIYLGWVLIVFLMPAMTTTRLVFAAVSSAYIVVAIPFEERSLRRTSGGAYDAYMRKVRWALLPGVY